MGFLGIGGTQDKFDASNPYDTQIDKLQDKVQAQYGNQLGIYNQQNELAQALLAMAQGRGPNPAQLQYQGNVNNNIANTQGLIASQRGLNPALAARMGVNAATAANNQAALGSALLQQNQQVGAAGALGNVLAQASQGNINQQQLLTGAFGQQQGINAGVSSGNAGRNAGMVGGLINAVGGVGAAAATPVAAAHGGVIGGKAHVPGNSPSNDTVPAMLSPGEGVIDREHMTSRKAAHAKVDEMFDKKNKGHDHEKTMELVDHLMKQKPKKKTEYKDVLAARRKKAA